MMALGGVSVAVGRCYHSTGTSQPVTYSVGLSSFLARASLMVYLFKWIPNIKPQVNQFTVLSLDRDFKILEGEVIFGRAL